MLGPVFKSKSTTFQGVCMLDKVFINKQLPEIDKFHQITSVNIYILTFAFCFSVFQSL